MAKKDDLIAREIAALNDKVEQCRQLFDVYTHRIREAETLEEREMFEKLARALIAEVDSIPARMKQLMMALGLPVPLTRN